MEFKWKYGSHNEKSPRTSAENKNPEKNPELDLIRENTTFKQCIDVEDSPWVSSTPWENNHLFSESPFRISNKREENSQKLTEREMVSQIGKNPFFENQNYIGDITNCEKFLKPECTSLNP